MEERQRVHDEKIYAKSYCIIGLVSNPHNSILENFTGDKKNCLVCNGHSELSGFLFNTFNDL